MSRPLQAKLLRFLEDGTFTRVGGTQELRVDVRLIAATNRNIIAAIKENDFREDLFHRLNVMQFPLPPLRDRGQDVLLLAEHFLKHFSQSIKKSVKRFTKGAQTKLLGASLARQPARITQRHRTRRHPRNYFEIQAGSLPDFSIETGLRKESSAPRAVAGQSLDETMANFERELVQNTLESNHFNLTRTAEQL